MQQKIFGTVNTCGIEIGAECLVKFRMKQTRKIKRINMKESVKRVTEQDVILKMICDIKLHN